MTTTGTDRLVAAPDLRVTDEPTILDTTEVRWFGRGPLPRDVSDWFTGDWTTGFVEARRDTYLLDGHHGTGLKRRFQETLELKERRSEPRQIDLGHGLVGELAEWRRWSPAVDVVVPLRSVRWIDVGKIVTKRRFLADGAEVAITTDARQMAGAGCDVEIVSLEVDSIEAWTFACAACGPADTRERSLRAAWGTIVDAGPVPTELTRLHRSSGYPAWLADNFCD